MDAKRTYILSIREREGDVLLEDVRTRRRARLSRLSEVQRQIDRWRDEDPSPAGAEPEPLLP